MRFPQSVTWLVVLVLMFTGSNLLGFITVIRQWEFIRQLVPDGLAYYLALIKLAWALVGLVILWGLLGAKHWAPSGLRAASLAYAFHFWLDRRAFQPDSMTAVSNAFTIGLTLVLLALIFKTLSRSAAQAYFGDAHEQSKED